MFDLFGDQVDTPLPALELDAVEVPLPQLLAWEKELLGTYVSEHPFRRAAGDLADFITVQASEVGEDLAGQKAILAGTVVNVRPLTTRQGKAFAAVTIEDLTGQVELTIWPDGYEEVRDLLSDATVVLAKVSIKTRNGRLTVAVDDLAAYDLEQRALVNAKPSRFRLRGSGGPQQARPEYRGQQNNTAPRGPSGPPNGGNRANLRPVQVAETPATYAPPVASGPHRLEIFLEETTDEAADRRRLRRISAALDRHEGDLPVDIIIDRGEPTPTRMRRRVGVNAQTVESVIPELRALLGVLGRVEESGVAAPVERELATATV